jgi:hypothetical protein
VPNEAVPFEKQTEAVPDVAESESPIEETALADKQVNWSSNVVTPYSGVAIGAEQKVFLGRIGPTRERERERECVCVCVCVVCTGRACCIFLVVIFFHRGRARISLLIATKLQKVFSKVQSLGLREKTGHRQLLRMKFLHIGHQIHLGSSLRR